MSRHVLLLVRDIFVKVCLSEGLCLYFLIKYLIVLLCLLQMLKFNIITRSLVRDHSNYINLRLKIN